LWRPSIPGTTGAVPNTAFSAIDIPTEAYVNSFLHPLRLIKLEPAVFFRQLITLLRYPGLPVRHSWRFALRHQNFNLAKHYDNSALNRFFGI
jgi:hypothetical protein